jgi:hypothetical protein
LCGDDAADAAFEASWRDSDWWPAPWPPPALLRRGGGELPRTPGAAVECVYGRALARRALAALRLEVAEGRAMAEAAHAFDRGRSLRFALRALISRRDAQRAAAVTVQTARFARQMRGWCVQARFRKERREAIAKCRRMHLARRACAALRFWAQHAADRRAKAAAAAAAEGGAPSGGAASPQPPSPPAEAATDRRRCSTAAGGLPRAPAASARGAAARAVARAAQRSSRAAPASARLSGTRHAVRSIAAAV